MPLTHGKIGIREELAKVFDDLAVKERTAAIECTDPTLSQMFHDIADGTELRAELMRGGI